jgi:hypothetical protein
MDAVSCRADRVNTPIGTESFANTVKVKIMATNEERVINSRLKMLKKELDRNEELMKQAAISYEDLVAEKESLQSTIEGLRKSRKEMRERESNLVSR